LAWTICPQAKEAAPEEIEAINEWLKREGTCLLVAPHHDVGFTDDFDQRQMEYKHHGDGWCRDSSDSANTRARC
jgi:hypothetical protein